MNSRFGHRQYQAYSHKKEVELLHILDLFRKRLLQRTQFSRSTMTSVKLVELRLVRGPNIFGRTP